MAVKEQLEGADSAATSDQSNNERKKKLGRLASGRSFSVASIKVPSRVQSFDIKMYIINPSLVWNLKSALSIVCVRNV